MVAHNESILSSSLLFHLTPPSSHQLYTPRIAYHRQFNSTLTGWQGSGYAWATVPANGPQQSGSYLLTHLTPGATYYARVSAVTARGLGDRRLAAPNAFAVPVTPPSPPTQREGTWGAPKLFLASPTSLMVRMGAPVFDGGSLAGQYLVQWDTVSTFNSGSSGQPLGAATVDAYSELCKACVQSIVWSYTDATPTVTVTYTGTLNNQRQLRAGARVVIVTTDDSLPYTFTVADSASSQTTFRVQSPGLREYIFNADSERLLKANLYLLGADYEIPSLTSGLNYFVRVKAENVAGVCDDSMLFIADCGAFTPTSPSAIVPRGAPTAVTVAASVMDVRTARVNWTLPVSIGTVVAYRVEAYTKSVQASAAQSSFYGDQEVQVVSTANAQVTGEWMCEE